MPEKSSATVAPQPDKNTFSVWKVLLPVAIGLGVVVLMFCMMPGKRIFRQ